VSAEPHPQPPPAPWPKSIVVERERVDGPGADGQGYRYVVVDGSRSTDFVDCAAYDLGRVGPGPT
jgi:hypothetical protein